MNLRMRYRRDERVVSDKTMLKLRMTEQIGAYCTVCLAVLVVFQGSTSTRRYVFTLLPLYNHFPPTPMARLSFALLAATVLPSIMASSVMVLDSKNFTDYIGKGVPALVEFCKHIPASKMRDNDAHHITLTLW